MKFPYVGQTSLLLVPLVIGTSVKTTSAVESALLVPLFLLGGVTNAFFINHDLLEAPRNLKKKIVKKKAQLIDRTFPDELDNILISEIKKFRSGMPYGFPDFDIPILDPLKLSKQNVNLSSLQYGNLTLYMDNITITGLSKFIIDHARLSVSGPNITANLTVPEVYAKGWYNSTGNIKIMGTAIEPTGSGRFNATVTNVRLYFKTMLGFSCIYKFPCISKRIYMKSFDLDFSFDSIPNLDLENFMVGSFWRTPALSQVPVVIGQLLNASKPEILPHVQDYIGDFANKTVNELTVWKFVKFNIGTSKK